MILPYTIAGTRISQEAIYNLPEQIRGWEVIEYTPELLNELGVQYGNNGGSEIGQYSRILRDPNIVDLSFIGNDPQSCIGHITDTTYDRRDENDTVQMHAGRRLAQLACHDYLTRQRGVYLGRWAYGVRSWGSSQEFRQHK